MNRQTERQDEQDVPAGAHAHSDVGGGGLQLQPNPEVERVVDRMAAQQERSNERERREFVQWLRRFWPGWSLRSRR